MGRYEFDIGIIGAGAAGLTVASSAARLGAKTVLIEAEPLLGGEYLHYGCVPSKTLIKSAAVYHEIKKAEKYGLPEIDLPPVHFPRIRQRIESVIAHIQEHDSHEYFRNLGVSIKHGDARFQNEHTVHVGHEKITARMWVIATGASPQVAPITGIETVSFLTNRDVFSLGKMPHEMCVIGAGPVGLEMAQSFARLGSKVTVIDVAKQILVNEDKDLTDMLKEQLMCEGVRFNLGVKIKVITEAEDIKTLVLQLPDDRELTVQCDEVLLATGRSPNVEGLGLEKIGVEYTRRGIKVDKCLRTTVKHIFAAGDVTGMFPFTHAARYEASVVVRNAIFKVPRAVNYSNLPWCTFTDPELASIGLNEQRAREAGIAYTIVQEKIEDNDRCIVEGNRSGMVKVLLDHTGKPLGAQIFGPYAGELLGEWIAVMNSRLSLNSVASAMHPYPTVGEINKRVAGVLLGKRIFSEKTRKILKMLFRYRG